MDSNAWVWGKKPTEKTIIDAGNGNLSSKWNDEEIQALLSDKEELEKDLEDLSDHLTTALFELNAKDEFVKKYAERTQDAITSLTKAEAESIFLKQELNEALHHGTVGEERLSNLDAALKECMNQLRLVREDHEKKAHDAKEFEISKMVLEEKLAQTSKKNAKMGIENSHLIKALLVSEQLIEDLNKQKTRVETDLNAVMAGLDSTERDNASLKYEIQVLKKELEIQNEEREFYRRAADATNKQHLDSVKKIAEFDSECQRLRVLVRKRFPGPAASAKMKNEVGMLESDSVEARKRRLSPSPAGPTVDSLTEQLHAMEEENKTLKEALNRTTNELQLSHIRNVHTTCKLSQVESLIEGTLEPSRSSCMSQELSLASVSEIGSDDKGICSESWTHALISELDHFRSAKQKGLLSTNDVRASDINLMDDFLEMEKLAVLTPSGASPVSSVQCNVTTGTLETETRGNSSQVTGKEIALVPDSQPGFGTSSETRNPSYDDVLGSLQHRLEVILDQNRAKLKSPEEILEDIRAALRHNNSLKPLDKSPSTDFSGAASDFDFSQTDESSKQLHSDISKSICKIIELIDGIGYDSPWALSRKDKTTATGYIVRVFQWKLSEVAAVLEQYVQTCYCLLNGKADLNRFSEETASALDWIINHCFSIQDVSSMRNEMEKQYGWEESLSENDHNNFARAEELQSNMTEENRKLEDELLNTVSVKQDLEARLEAAISKNESLLNQLGESGQKIASMEKVDEQIQNYKSMNEDLDAQLIASRSELTKAYQNLSSLEAELENKTSRYEELEVMCVELQLQLESVTKRENLNHVPHEEGKQLQAGWEILAASEKLAECQDTILNLEKQIKALAATKEATLADKVISTTTDSTITTMASTPPRNKSLTRRSSLLDHMIAEDYERKKVNPKRITSPNATEHHDTDTTVGSRVIVANKKQGHMGLWRKMMWRRKRGHGKKTSPSFHQS